MSRRRILVTLAAIGVLALLSVIAVRHLEQNRVIHAGNAIVAIEGRDFTWWNNDFDGVGVTGTLGLVGGRCVGFLADGIGLDAVIVWPPGTNVSGEGLDLRITSEGKTVRMGDRINGGSERGHDFSGIRKKLPAECLDARLVQVGLNS